MSDGEGDEVSSSPSIRLPSEAISKQEPRRFLLRHDDVVRRHCELRHRSLLSEKGPSRTLSEEDRVWLDSLFPRMKHEYMRKKKDKKSAVSCEAQAQHIVEKAEGPVITMHPFFHSGEDGFQVQEDEGETMAAGEEAHHICDMPTEAMPAGKEALGDDVLQGGEDKRKRKFEAPRNVEEEEECVFIFGGVWRCEPESEPEVLPRKMEVEKVVCDIWMQEDEHEEPELVKIGPDDAPHWMTVGQYRRHWNKRWSGHYGSFEDITRIPPMQFTDKPLDTLYVTSSTLQVYSVKLAATRGSLQLPLDVFGMVAVRDTVDHNRNLIFQRNRDGCQTLTRKDPYLILEGPTRAVIFSEAKSNPVIIEVDLKVKGTNESEDQCLSFLVSQHTCCGGLLSRAFKCPFSTKFSTLEFTIGHIVQSVEATMFVRVIQGSWPDGLRGQFVVSTTGFTDKCTTEYSSGVGHERIILLDSGDKKLPVAGDGEIKLSRRVISVESCGKLIFQVKALEGDTSIAEEKVSFAPLEANRSISELGISFCRMQVTVVWSLVSCYDD